MGKWKKLETAYLENNAYVQKQAPEMLYKKIFS